MNSHIFPGLHLGASPLFPSTFKQFMNSWNVNIKAIYELPYATHSFLAEELTGAKNARQMVYKRFINFLSSIANNRREGEKVGTVCVVLCLGALAGISELWVPTEAMEAEFFSQIY